MVNGLRLFGWVGLLFSWLTQLFGLLVQVYLIYLNNQQPDLFSSCWEMVRTAPAHLFKTACHTSKTSVKNTLSVRDQLKNPIYDYRIYHKLFFEVSYALW